MIEDMSRHQPLPQDLIDRYYDYHDEPLKSARLYARVHTEQNNIQKQCEIVNLLLSELKHHPKPYSILDIGAGIGSILYRFHEAGCKTCGIEYSFRQIKLANEYAVGQASFLVNAAGESLPFADASFDGIVSMSVLEHCMDPASFLLETLRVLRPNGIFYLVFPNYNFIWEPHYDVLWPMFLPKVLFKWYLRLKGRDPSFVDTLNFTTPKSMRKLLAQENCSIEDMSIRIFQKRLLGESSTSVPGVSNTLSFLRKFGVGHILVWMARLGFYHPVVWMIRKQSA